MFSAVAMCAWLFIQTSTVVGVSEEFGEGEVCVDLLVGSKLAVTFDCVGASISNQKQNENRRRIR